MKANLQLSLQELQLQLFSCKNISQIVSKTFTTQCFLTDHLNHKTLNKATWRTPSSDTCQLFADQLNCYDQPTNFLLSDQQLAENMILVSCFQDRKKRDESEFATSLQELQLQLFSCKNISQIVSKTFTTQCFFTDHLNYKILNKATCGTPSANPCQICADQLNCYDYLSRLSGFSDLFGKLF